MLKITSFFFTLAQVGNNPTQAPLESYCTTSAIVKMSKQLCGASV